MLTVSVPGDEARSYLGDLPAEVQLVDWDGTGPRPDGAEQVEMFVGRYNAPPPPAAVFAGLPALRVIQLLSAGVEPWLPVVPDGVTLCSGRGVHGASTAELAVAGLLAVVREIPAFLAAQAEHRWDELLADGLDGRHVLVLGAGDIGARVATAVGAFDADVTLIARRARDGVRTIDELPELLPTHDVVVVAVPLTAQTFRLVDKRFLAALPDGAVLVNVARGAIVDTDALLAELNSRRLRAFLPDGHQRGPMRRKCSEHLCSIVEVGVLERLVDGHAQPQHGRRLAIDILRMGDVRDIRPRQRRQSIDTQKLLCLFGAQYRYDLAVRPQIAGPFHAIELRIARGVQAPFGRHHILC